MATAIEILRTLTDAELRQATREALSWSKSGILQGDVLRTLAARLETEAGISPDGLLRDTDTLVCREAARRFADNE